jgi:hypothetical protein
MKRKSARRKVAAVKASKAPTLTYSAAFTAMDLIDSAVIDLEGTFNILEQIIGDMSPHSEEAGWFITMKLHFEADRRRLAENIKKARAAILKPLFTAEGRTVYIPPGMEKLQEQDQDQS